MNYIMLKQYCLFFSLCIFFLSVKAEKAPIRFGELTLDKINLMSYGLDKTASAVILCDYGTSDMPYSKTEGFQMIFKRIIRIKILKKDGLKWANLSIPVRKKK